MLPKEHGAYGQLLFPMVTAMAMGRPSLAALWIAITATAMFLAHEPALVLAGARGARARREDGGRARHWLTLLAGGAVASGATALASVPPGNRWTLVVPVAAAGLAGLWSVRGRERTTGGEVAAGVALAAAAFPVGVAAGLPVPVAAGCVAAFMTGTTAATLSVRAVIGRARGLPTAVPLWAIATVSAVLVALTGLLASAGVIHAAGFWGGLPLTIVALGIAVASPPPRFLRRVGWTLLAGTALSALVLVMNGRLG